MAKVRISRNWPDNDFVSILVVADSGYPQELHEAMRVALDGFAETSGVVLKGSEDEATSDHDR